MGRNLRTFRSRFFGSMPYTARRKMEVGSFSHSLRAVRSFRPPAYLQHAYE